MLFDSPYLEVNLGQIQENYASVAAAANVEVSAVVKANAYGLGSIPIACALWEAGCRAFWVARVSEALAIRSVLRDAQIFVLSGPHSDNFDLFHTHRLRPALNTPAQVRAWLEFSSGRDVEPATLHVETGFNRLGLSGQAIAEACNLWKSGLLKLDLLMSHLACVDTPGHPKNVAQLQQFKKIKSMFPSLRASLAASYGLFEKDIAFRQDMLRVGKILYGLRNISGQPLVTRPAISLAAPVTQIATIQPEETVGYDAAWRATGLRRIATLSIGYADGLPRSLEEKGEVYFTHGPHTYAAPVAGKVSMDLLTCDVTDIPHGAAQEGSTGYFIDARHDIASFSETCGISGYEALTHLTDRVRRVYLQRS